MKCKHCDGTGTTNWCVNGTFKECPYCGGTGEVDRFNAVDVLKVMEMVKKPHTNEEWLRSATTEQLTIFLARQKCDGCSDNPYDEKHGTCKYCMAKKTEQIREWLKQPHREVGK